MASEFILEARGVSRQYPGTLALDAVSFGLRPGAVTALIGENGAGKSTLVKILAGIDRPTSGSLLLDGHPVVLGSVRDAAARGIGIIHQELNLCLNLSVAENIFLARELTRRGALDKRAQEAQARALLARLEHPIDPRTLVGDLPLGQQQIVEIAKALSRNIRVLMMDEPTSALSASEIAVLFRIIGDLRSRGVAIAYISHRLEELLEIADHVSVLRDGRMVAESPARGIGINWIVEQMTGRPAEQPHSVEPRAAGNQLLRLDSISLNAAGGRPLLRNVSLDLRAGEILGLYGLMGAGRTELLECVMGLHPEATGSVHLESRNLGRLATAARIAAGLAMVPEDRQAAGIVQSMTVRANMTLSSLARYVRAAWLSPSAEHRAATEISAGLRIKSPGLGHSIASLSGGNQQKVVMAKCLLTRPRVLLLDEPTRGVDVGAKREIHTIVRGFAESGIGVILASSELDEIRATAGRVAVLSRGRLTAILPAAQATAEALVAAASPSAGEEMDAA
jgi:erythritol transport system ATP-binding protein